MKPEPDELPRCEHLDGSTLRIVPSYIEAGEFCEANCITVTDGERTVVYVPFAVAGRSGDQPDLSHHTIDAGLPLSVPAASVPGSGLQN